MQTIEERFAPIQEGLPDLWRRIQNPRVPRLVIAVPSLSLDLEGLPLPGGLLHFEERMLYLFHLLGQPSCRLWFYSSHLIPEEEIAYYLHFLRHVPFSHGRNRLRLQPLLDREIRPLTEKMLARPALLERLRRQIAKSPNAYLTVYRSTELEMRLAVELGIPIMGTDPRHQQYSAKGRARALFQSLGLAVPPGEVDLHDLDDLAAALVRLQSQGVISVETPRVVVKQNDGVSGLGNRDLSLMPFWNLLVSEHLLLEEKHARLGQALRRHWGDAEGRAFWPRFERLGGLVEQQLSGESVSVQLQISPLFEVSVRGVHHELLDKHGRYRGAVFPAPDPLAQATVGRARKVGEALAAQGVQGRVEVDFLVTSAEVYALDVNFRKSNSTTSLRTLNLLAGGGYHEADNRYIDGSGKTKYFYASDWLEVGPQASSLQDVIDLATEQGLNYSTASHTGVVFHMLGGVSSTGRLGVTCVGENMEEARCLYEESERALGKAALVSA
ncbi:MAG: peptide ligase PGM1-related protein [Vulcanimicrobiota bacterium]